MDPNETIVQIILAYESGDIQEANLYASYLQDWIKSGGYSPDRSTMLALLDKNS